MSTLHPAHSPSCAKATSFIRVLLVEDDVNFQDHLVASIGNAPDMALVGVAVTRAQGLQALELPQPDVLLVDLGLPDGSGIDVIRGAHARWPGCAIMVSTSFGDEANVIDSIEAGASGYLLKDSSSNRMADEIRSLHAGGSPISPLIARQVLMRFRGNDQAGATAPAPLAAAAPAASAQRARAALSVREHEVLTLITKGYKADEIAGLMQVSRYTVLSFVRRIYVKLEVNSKAEAIYEARSQGLLED